MVRRLLSGGLCAAAFSAAIVLGFAIQASAEGKVPASFAVKTAVGPSDAPVRTAEYGEQDRAQVKFQSVGWRGRAYGPYYRGAFYAPAPVYSYYYPAPPMYTYVPRRAYYAPPVFVPYGTYYYYGW